jgi:hypothetical protein
MPETDAEQEIECVMDMVDDAFTYRFYLSTFTTQGREIRRLVIGKPRQLRVMFTQLEGK